VAAPSSASERTVSAQQHTRASGRLDHRRHDSLEEFLDYTAPV
jgi:hypothetical protein